VLRGGDFVVFRLGEDSEFPEFFVEIVHKLRDTRFQRAEIVVFKLLSFRGARSEQCASGVDKVRPFQKLFLVNDEVFLLGADGCKNAFDVRFAECRENAFRLFGKSVHRAQKRGLFIERFARV